MNNQLEIFNNEELGVEVRLIEIDGEGWLVGKDVAEVLGYKKPQNAISTHVDEDDTLKWGIMDRLGRNQETTLINESGLYSLVLGSKLPSAKKFRKWVTSEVLPSIRKNGMFAVDELLDNPDLLIATATKLKEERIARLLAEEKIEEYEPMIEEYKQFIECPEGCVFVDEYSKSIGLGRNKLFAILRELEILQTDESELGKVKGRRHNLPYEKYMKYFEVKFAVKNDRKFSVTLINNKGQSYIYRRLKKEGYLE